MRQLTPVVILAAALLFTVVRFRQRRGLARFGAVIRRRRSADSPATGQDGRSAPLLLGVTGLVAAREMRQRLRGRIFRVATVLLLVGVAAAIVLPVVTEGKAEAQQVGVVGTLTPSLRRSVDAAAASVKAEIHFVTETNTASAEDALRSGGINLAVVGGDKLVVKRAISSDDTSQTATFARALAQLLGVHKTLQAAGLTGTQQARLAGAEPLPIASLEPARTTSAGRSTALVGLIVMVVLLSQYLTWTLIGVMEEKSSRVVEVLLSAVRPMQLLAGKVIGIGAVVFAQAALVVGFALVLARAVGSDLLHGTTPLVLLATLVWLLLGYAFYCWVYAAAGSMAERQDQVQSLAIPLVLPIIVGYVASVSVLAPGNPAPVYLKVLAYLPPTAPFAMTALVGLGSATWWQFTLSAACTVAGAVAVARIAVTVYRRAILRTGRRVGVREIMSARAR